MDFSAIEATACLDHSFQKEKGGLAQKGSLGKRRPPSRPNIRFVTTSVFNHHEAKDITSELLTNNHQDSHTSLQSYEDKFQEKQPSEYKSSITEFPADDVTSVKLKMPSNSETNEVTLRESPQSSIQMQDSALKSLLSQDNLSVIKRGDGVTTITIAGDSTVTFDTRAKLKPINEAPVLPDNHSPTKHKCQDNRDFGNQLLDIKPTVNSRTSLTKQNGRLCITLKDDTAEVGAHDDDCPWLQTVQLRHVNVEPSNRGSTIVYISPWSFTYGNEIATPSLVSTKVTNSCEQKKETVTTTDCQDAKQIKKEEGVCLGPGKSFSKLTDGSADQKSKHTQPTIVLHNRLINRREILPVQIQTWERRMQYSRSKNSAANKQVESKHRNDMKKYFKNFQIHEKNSPAHLVISNSTNDHKSFQESQVFSTKTSGTRNFSEHDTTTTYAEWMAKLAKTKKKDIDWASYEFERDRSSRERVHQQKVKLRKIYTFSALDKTREQEPSIPSTVKSKSLSTHDDSCAGPPLTGRCKPGKDFIRIKATEKEEQFHLLSHAREVGSSSSKDRGQCDEYFNNSIYKKNQKEEKIPNRDMTKLNSGHADIAHSFNSLLRIFKQREDQIGGHSQSKDLFTNRLQQETSSQVLEKRPEPEGRERKGSEWEKPGDEKWLHLRSNDPRNLQYLNLSDDISETNSKSSDISVSVRVFHANGDLGRVCPAENLKQCSKHHNICDDFQHQFFKKDSPKKSHQSFTNTHVINEEKPEWITKAEKFQKKHQSSDVFLNTS
ncbi:uncharacterized protein LOC143238105 [Tachypleus tridentatus]|uniref:uncharacterized protein LOC143238105 n=1 Tax=Tachypleus tridentatus TaxID=6853 RepID=UPI003FD4F142